MANHFLQPLQNIKQSFSLSDIDPNIDFTNQFSGLVPFHQENFHSFMGFPQDNDLSENLENFNGLFIHEKSNSLLSDPLTTKDIIISNYSDRKRKAMESNTPESSSAYSSPQISDNGIRKKNSGSRGKRVKGNGKEEEKQGEVVHVRAKRGQATDSHSLAERVRRGKINERLRCLQDIVPGCYKTMGMSVMLDEIINYVQSLQNQVEFLSMKLTAASTFHDFNSDTDVIETMQRAKAFEAMKIHNNGASQLGIPSAQFGPLDFNFGYFPQFPHNS
ncbi:hypothetical protein ACJIZ3_017022 [Penstemon smallii]|uniref:BHLH domain-containing protein n=1 Tax=Penstemon smallii TaxID=265156 RepID=A0ABD3SV60_9LAMI